MPQIKQGWIGVDLDGTLAEYHGWKGAGHVGAPIGPMVERVRRWLAEGVQVRIFTSRVGDCYPDQILANCLAIDAFCKKQFGRSLPITNKKDQHMISLWDDRAHRVVFNTGEEQS